jgi:hypothetical protein
MRTIKARSTTSVRKTLPKNGESHFHSVGFCRLGQSNDVAYYSLPYLTAVLSIKLLACPRKSIAGMRFALSSATYKIGFPGWPEPNLDSVTGFGASIEKKGACTSPLFYFSGPFRAVLKWWLAKSTREPPWCL